MEKGDNVIVKWAQEDVETSYSLLNKYKYGDDDNNNNKLTELSPTRKQTL